MEEIPEHSKHAGGRPAKFATPEELQEAIDNYFIYVKGDIKEEMPYRNGKTGRMENFIIWNREPQPITITGLALYLGFESRQSLHDYEKHSQFSYIIKKARLKVENNYEGNLQSNNPTGSIFALKNMGWKDKTETEITKVKTKVSFKDDPGS